MSDETTPLVKGKTIRINNISNLVLIVLVANIGVLLFGYEIGATSWLLLSLTDLSESTDEFYYHYVSNSSLLTGLIGAGGSFGAAITYIFLLLFANFISKKNEILIAASLFFVGGFLCSYSGQLDWNQCYGLIVLIIGRLVYGAAIAASLHSTPQYIAEVVPTELRGQFGSSTEAMIMTGMTLGFGLGYLFESESGGWVVTFRCSYIIAVFMAILALFIPNSPTWLIHNNYPMTNILDALAFIYANASEEMVVEETLKITDEEENRKKEQIARFQLQHQLQQSTIDNSHDIKINKILLYFIASFHLTPEVKLLFEDVTLFRGMLVLCCLNTIKTLCGQPAILYYADDLFSTISPSHSNLLIVGFLLTRVLVSYVMLFLAEMFGRRDFLVSSALVMFLSVLMMTIGFAADSAVLSVVGVYVSGFGFEFGFGSISYLLMAELTPYYVRSSTNAIANSILFFLLGCVNFLYPATIDAIGFTWCFFIFTLCNL
eukprot:gene14264-19140_t